MSNRSIRFGRATAVFVLTSTCIGLAYTPLPMVGPAAAATTAEKAKARGATGIIFGTSGYDVERELRAYAEVAGLR
jgi:hypothetical protein